MRDVNTCACKNEISKEPFSSTQAEDGELILSTPRKCSGVLGLR